LEAAKRLRFRAIVEGIRSIIQKTNAHQKYNHLAAALARLGYLRLPADLGEHVFPVPRPGLSAKLGEITVNTVESEVDVVYVQPRSVPGERCIDFESFASHVRKFDDPFSKRFAEHLLAWRDPAGAQSDPSVFGLRSSPIL
jgi:hypothetical protein